MNNEDFRVPERLAAASNLDIALSWAAQGCPVFPVGSLTYTAQGVGKTETKPLVNWGTEHTTNPDEVRSIWSKLPDALVGVITGSTVFTLDVDRHDDVDGFQSLTDAGITVPDTACADTPRGGRHYFYRGLPDLGPDANLAHGDTVLRGVDRRTGKSYFKAYSLAPDLSKLPEAPLWATVRKRTGSRAEGVGYSGTVSEWLAEHGGTPNVAMAYVLQSFPAPGYDFDRGTMLAKQSAVVLAAADGADGASYALDLLRSLWLTGQWDTEKYRQDWDKGLEGAVAKFGGTPELPLMTTAEEPEPESGNEDPNFRKEVDKRKRSIYADAKAREEYLSETNAFGVFDPARVVSVDDWEPGYSMEPLIENVLERGTIGMLYADSFIGKSYVGLDWGLSIATGRSRWAGNKVSEATVLYLAMEGAATLSKRVQAWTEYTGITEHSRFLMFDEAVSFANASSHGALCDYVRDNGVELVIIDMAAQSMGGWDENKPTEVNEWMNRVSAIREANPGCSVLFLHHSKKDNPREYRGGTPFYGASDFVWLMTRLEQDDKNDPRRALECTKWKSNAGHMPKASVLSFFAQSNGDSVLDVAIGGDKYDATVEQLRAEGFTFPTSRAAFAREVSERYDGSAKSHENKIGRLIRDGRLDVALFTS